MTSQDILEYVCWLVDANAIYEASLLTYDLEMASMAARCTQMVSGGLCRIQNSTSRTWKLSSRLRVRSNFVRKYVWI